MNDNQTAREQGKAAYRDGKGIDANPYPSDSGDGLAWGEGWIWRRAHFPRLEHQNNGDPDLMEPDAGNYPPDPETCWELQDRQRHTAFCETLAQKLKIELPTSFYRYTAKQCWSCNQPMLVFAWPGQDNNHSTPPKQEPRPPSIQYRYSKTAGGEYWANVCPHCNRIQGDFYLFSEPDGPFFGLRDLKDTPSAFLRDLQIIASRPWSQRHEDDISYRSSMPAK
jgi:hypothetical protein